MNTRHEGRKNAAEESKTSGTLKNTEGMALVLVLLILSIITALVVDFAYNVYIETNALHNWQVSQKLSLVARSATKLGGRLISQNNSMFDYTYPGLTVLSREIPFEDLKGNVTLRIEDEGGKFSLNSLIFRDRSTNQFSYDGLVRLLKSVGLQERTADRIADWIDPDSEPRLGDSEVGSKNAYLDSVEELCNIPGVTREACDTLLPFVTIYGTYGNGANSLVNINTAEIPVLMSLSDSITREMAERIVYYRNIAPFRTKDDFSSVPGFGTIGTSLTNYISFKGIYFRINAKADSDEIIRSIESVIRVSTDGRTVQYWKEI